MVKVPQTLDFLLNVFNKIWLFGELLLIDALDWVDLIFGRFELDFLNWEDEGEGAFPKFLEGM